MWFTLAEARTCGKYFALDPSERVKLERVGIGFRRQLIPNALRVLYN